MKNGFQYLPLKSNPLPYPLYYIMTSIEQSQVIAIQEETIETLERTINIMDERMLEFIKIVLGSVLFFGVVSIAVIGLLISILTRL